MATSTEYIKSTELNLFSRESFAGISYTDGAAAEDRLYASVCAATDRSTFSQELSRAIIDWPSEYHLSRERHCLVRPLGIQPGDSVLELGCGCGAITRYLGELGAQVTGVEGSMQRGRIAAERCRDLPNVRLVIDDLIDFETSERFHWILLVGVLEYASVFSDQKDAATHYLRSAARFLAPDGKLVIAIENKLGLKYFNALAEDHLGAPFLGVQGLYGEKTPRTFGRRELEFQIKAAGLEHIEFYYPFPDYKLPQVILSQRALSDELFDAADLLALCSPRDYDRNALRLFNDPLVMREVKKNGLLADLSNSFLVVASKQAFSSNVQDLATTYAVWRVKAFATQTRFFRSPTGIQVVKEPLDPEAIRHTTLKEGGILSNLLHSAEYVPGGLLYWRLLVVRAQQGGLKEMVEAFTPWFQYLLAHAVTPKAECQTRGLSISGDSLDLTPFNLIEGSHGLVAIDQEWSIDRDIPLCWLVIRSLLSSLTGPMGFETPPIRIQDIARALYANHGLAVSQEEMDDALNREVEFRSIVCGSEQKRISSDVTSLTWQPLHQAVAELETRVNALHRIVAEQECQIASLKHAATARDARTPLPTQVI